MQTKFGRGVRMVRNSFNRDWMVGTIVDFFNMKPGDLPKSVMLPHDAMIEKKRTAEAVSGHKKGYFPDGNYSYSKKFDVPVEYKDKRVTFEFEGVYMNAMVYINGDFAGQHPYGYSNFYVKADQFLKYGEENEIKVVSKTHDDSRWYTGAGIYRDTKIIVANPVHIAIDGVKITTPNIGKEHASVVVATAIENEGMNPHSTTLVTEILDEMGNSVAVNSAPFTAFAGECSSLCQRLYIKEPRLWYVESPCLYTCRTKLLDGENILDEELNTFGIRSLTLDAVNGLRINEQTIKLRGACIHHDNGVIGAATIGRAEERRVEILKEAGFNAIRSAHHPMSKALLEACDRLGMLVMDEAFDTWTYNKSIYDYALNFHTWWEEDIKGMVDKDFNHPCVIMYSIGNEIPETGHPAGALWGRRLAEKIRNLDSTRFTINSMNAMMSVSDKLQEMMPTSQKTSDNAETDFNSMIAGIGDMLKAVAATELVTDATAESYAAVDIAGYNYMDSRYEMDKDLFPNRVICGTETFPKDIAGNWKLVRANSHIIGDFTWTGWDYLGEASLGRVVYEEDGYAGVNVNSPYPWLMACSGDIDITGYRCPASYYREIVYGLRNTPYIAVLSPEKYGKNRTLLPWAWSDAVSSWSWAGYDGKPVKVEVYSDADEVDLLVNGRSIGKAAAGEANSFKAEFDIVYEPGEITAIAYRDGEESGRTFLKSADSTVHLKVEADREKIEANDKDLAFITIEFVDEKGILMPLADRKVSVKVEGAGILQGLGSANPRPDGNFFDAECTTFNGRALAVVRPEAKGSIEVIVEAEGCIQQRVNLEAC